LPRIKYNFYYKKTPQNPVPQACAKKRFYFTQKIKLNPGFPFYCVISIQRQTHLSDGNQYQMFLRMVKETSFGAI